MTIFPWQRQDGRMDDSHCFSIANVFGGIMTDLKLNLYYLILGLSNALCCVISELKWKLYHLNLRLSNSLIHIPRKTVFYRNGTLVAKAIKLDMDWSHVAWHKKPKACQQVNRLVWDTRKKFCFWWYVGTCRSCHNTVWQSIALSPDSCYSQFFPHCLLKRYGVPLWAESLSCAAECLFVCDHSHYSIVCNIDGLMQERHNSSALAMDFHLSCIGPSISCYSELCFGETNVHNKFLVYNTVVKRVWYW